MRKIISLFLVLSLLFVSSPACFAGLINESTPSLKLDKIPEGFTIGSQQYGAWAWKDTDKYSCIIHFGNDGSTTLVCTLRMSPYTEYTYNFEANQTANIDSILENISSITVASNENTFDNRALNDVESDVLEIAEDMMIDEYGNEYYEYGIRTKTYSDMTVRIDETFYIFADCIDWVELDESLTHAASVTKMAARFGVATPMALLIFATLVTTYNALENLQEKIGVGLYQGTAITERNGFAKLNGSTSFVPTAISATESIIERIGATIDENNVIQSVEFVGNPDVLYAPSEYEFDVSVILDDVHDLMSN